jgi:hypothetical protein
MGRFSPSVGGGAMSRQFIAKTKLEDLLLKEIRKHSGCERISKLEVVYFADPRFEVNWRIDRIEYGHVDLIAAAHAAHFAQEKLRPIYLLE